MNDEERAQDATRRAMELLGKHGEPLLHFLRNQGLTPMEASLLCLAAFGELTVMLENTARGVKSTSNLMSEVHDIVKEGYEQRPTKGLH